MAEARGRIVLVHRYFSPDTPPYASILERIAQRLAADGHEVTVLTCQPSYRPEHSQKAPPRERVNGYDVVRWPVLPDRTSAALKAVNLVWFCLRLVLARRHFAGADAVMAATTPPVLLAAVVCRLARAHGARFVYHKQDIYPEVMAPEKGWSSPMRALQRLDAATERRSAAVVVLSGDMARTVQTRHRRPVPVEVINNFDPWTLREPGDAPTRWEGPLRVTFAGNLGNFQGLDSLRELIELTSADADVEYHFFGDGARSAEFRELAASRPNVTYHGFQPAAEVAAFVRDQADLGVVSLETGVIQAAYPSKTMTYLRNACPLLLLVEESELSSLVQAEGIGITGDARDLPGLAARLRGLAADRSSLPTARKRALEVYDESFSPDRQLDKWTRLYQGLVTR